jgi:fluoroquinolone transport system permease protein
MKKYLQLLSYEFKTLLRDPMNMFMFIYPLFMLGFVGWLIPTILVRSGIDTQGSEYALSLMVLFVLILAIGGFISGTLLGFSLLENKDEQTIKAIAVSPITVTGYTLFKTTYAFMIGFIGNLVMLFGLKYFFGDTFSVQYGDIAFGINNINNFDIILFSLVSSLLTPTAGALMAGIAKNKIEGFALMKTGGILFMVPMLILLETFGDWKQFILGIAPNFWAVKGFYNLAFNSQGSSDLGYGLYLLIGSVYMLVLAGISLRFFVKRVNAERSS